MPSRIETRSTMFSTKFTFRIIDCWYDCLVISWIGRVHFPCGMRSVTAALGWLAAIQRDGWAIGWFGFHSISILSEDCWRFVTAEDTCRTLCHRRSFVRHSMDHSSRWNSLIPIKYNYVHSLVVIVPLPQAF